MAHDVARTFLDEAVARGYLTTEQVDTCLRIAAVMLEVDVDLPLPEITRRKGFLNATQIAEVQRALARRRVGKYQVIERLGEGASGIVWRALDTSLDRIVALKVLSKDDEGAGDFQARFLREARVAVTLNHVNIVRGLDYGESDGYRFFAMEFVAGTTLAERLDREGRIEQADAFRIAGEVVRALEYVQQFGLVHRDIKPENLLLTPTGGVKVCDLGLAKPTLEEAARMREGGLTAGTPLYMSPEQIRDPHRLDWRADVYSLGATLYHALTGRPPFTGAEGGSVIHKHLTEPPVNPREHCLDLTSGAAAVVLKMLHKDPADRYGSLAELAADLQAVADGRPPVNTVSFAARDETAEYEIAARQGRGPTRRIGLVGVASAVLVCGALGWAGWSLPGLLDAPAPALPDATVNTPPRPPDTPRLIESGSDAGTAQKPPVHKPGPGAGPGAGPSQIDEQGELDAQRALGIARGDVLEGRLLQARAQFKFILATHAGTSAARLAETELHDLANRLELLAQEELARRVFQSEECLKREEYRDAWLWLHEFPSAHDETDAARDAVQRADKLRDRCVAYVDEALGLVRSAIDAARIAEGAAHLERAHANAIGDVQVRYETTKREFEVAAEQHEAQRREHRPAFLDLFTRALLTFGRAGEEAALNVVNERDVAPLARLFREEIRELRHDIEWAAGIDALLLSAGGEGPTEGSFVVRVQANEPGYSLEQLDAVASQVLRDDVSREQEGLLILYLSLGDLGRAEKQLSRMSELRMPIAEARARTAHVEFVLDEDARRIAREVRTLIDAGDVVGAAQRLSEEGLRRFPNHPHIRLSRGLLLRAVQPAALEDALAEFERARGLPEADLWRGRVLRELTRLKDARAALAEAAATLPQGSPLALAAQKEVRDVDAAIVLREAEPLRGRMLHAKRMRDWNGATAAGKELLGLLPTDQESLYTVGVAYHAHAERAGNRLLLDAWLYLSRVDESNRQFHTDSARRLRAIEASADEELSLRAASLVEQGRDLLKTEDYPTAHKRFIAALDIAPFLESALLGLARAELAEATVTEGRVQFAAANEAFDRLLTRHPTNAPAHLGRARCRLQLGRFAGSAADARVAAAADPSDAAPTLVLGQALLRLQDGGGALEAFTEAANRGGGVEAQLGLVEAYQALDRIHAAREVLQSLLETYGEPIELRARIAAAAAALGAYDEE